MGLADRALGAGPKRLLAIDGGGIRGVIALEILRRVEALLGKGDPGFRLAHYFDYVAGTSTGGIIAAGLSLGMSVREIAGFYERAGPAMFARASLLKRLLYRYKEKPLADKLREVFAADVTLGSDRLRTLLLLVMRNASTDSPWPVSNNPFAKYNGRDRQDCNLHIPLWRLVRASTAAPTYFPPEVIEVGGRKFVFVDGGVTTYNNPAFQLFLMATVERYWPLAPEGRRGWATGVERMLLVSVGTGTSPGAREAVKPREMNLLFNATTIPAALMFAALNEQDFLCRVFGDCLAGDVIDREVGDMRGAAGPLPREGKLFTYLRYNAELTRKGLDALGCGEVAPERVQRLDAADAMPELRRVGEAAARQFVCESHFARFPA